MASGAAFIRGASQPAIERYHYFDFIELDEEEEEADDEGATKRHSEKKAKAASEENEPGRKSTGKRRCRSGLRIPE